jgi:hypothetical protein
MEQDRHAGNEGNDSKPLKRLGSTQHLKEAHAKFHSAAGMTKLENHAV